MRLYLCIMSNEESSFLIAGSTGSSLALCLLVLGSSNGTLEDVKGNGTSDSGIITDGSGSALEDDDV